MSNKNNSSKSIPSLLDSAISSMKDHERSLDVMIRRLEKVKEDLSANMKITNTNFGNVVGRIEVLDGEIRKLRAV